MQTETHLAASPKRRFFWIKFVCSVLALALITEFVAFQIVLRYHSGRDRAWLYHHFYIAKLLNPRPLEGNLYPNGLKARYVGHQIMMSTHREVFPYDPILGYRLGPDVVWTQDLWKSPGFHLNWSNSQGFGSAGGVDELFVNPKPKDTVRVIMLGGSTVLGNGTGVPSENISSHMKNEMAKRGSGRLAPSGPMQIEVINAGVAGYSTGQAVLYLGFELLRFDPDYVIVLAGWNDTFVGRDRSFYPPSYTASSIPVLRHRLHDRMSKEANALYRPMGAFWRLIDTIYTDARDGLSKIATSFVLKKVMDRIRIPRWFGSPSVAVQQSTGDDASTYDKRATGLGGDLRFLDLILREYGFRALAVLQPLLGEDNKPLDAHERMTLDNAGGAQSSGFTALREIYGRFREIGRQFPSANAAEGGLCFSDASRIFGAQPRQVYVDEGHLNSLGNSQLAASIVDSISVCWPALTRQ